MAPPLLPATPVTMTVPTGTIAISRAMILMTITVRIMLSTPPIAVLTPFLAPCDHQIIVGVDGKLEYGPPNITANVYDTVTFIFKPKNHTVTQSSFEHPCQPLADTSSTGEIGFASGLYVLPPRTSALFS